MVNNIFLQISALLGITVILAFVIKALKQPLLVAYMLAGIICGPLFLGLLGNNYDLFEAFSRFGIVLLLFIVGLSLNFSYLKKIGKTVILIGLSQFVLNFVLCLPIALAFGLNFLNAFFLALVACFSSTIVVLKLLTDKQDDEAVYGRYTIGLMLVQDIISIIVLIFLSMQSGSAGMHISTSLLLGGLVVLLVFLAAKFVLPKFLDHIASSGEFLFVFTVAWCFGVAALMYASGFSLEIGAIIAGLSLGASRYQPEIASRIKPLRDFFIVIFFIILGSQADISSTATILFPALAITAFVLLVKPLLLFTIFRKFKFTRKNSFLAALSSAQVSEFGFIILFAATQSGLLSGQILAIFTLVAILTIFISSYLIVYGEIIYHKLLPCFHLFGEDKHLQPEDAREKFDVIIFGYHRTAWQIGNALKAVGLSFAIVDYNPENVEKLKRHNLKVFFGDASDIEFLNTLPLKTAKAIISTIPSPEDQITLINYVRGQNKYATIIASLYHKKSLTTLYGAGADYIILPHLLSGNWMTAEIMNKALTKKHYWLKLKQIQADDLSASLN